MGYAISPLITMNSKNQINAINQKNKELEKTLKDYRIVRKVLGSKAVDELHEKAIEAYNFNQERLKAGLVKSSRVYLIR